jgi:hypothetical protein
MGSVFASTNALRVGGLEFFDRRAQEPPQPGVRDATGVFESQTPFKHMSPRDKLTKWAEHFYAEVAQFLLELQLEAGPYKESAWEQAKLGRRILDRSDILLPEGTPKDFDHNEGDLLSRARELSERVRHLVIKPLERAGKSSDSEAQRIFTTISIVFDQVFATADQLAQALIAFDARSPVDPDDKPLDKWTKADQDRFRKLIRREALNRISPAERRDLDELQERRRQILYPMSQQEQEASAEQWALADQQRRVTEELFEALNQFCKVHNAPTNTTAAKGI